MIVKDLQRGRIFAIVTSSYLKWIANEKSEKFLGLEFNKIY
jgi:hypothetical protein